MRLPEILNCYNSKQTAKQKIQAILELSNFPKQLSVQFAYDCANQALSCLEPGSEKHSTSFNCLNLIKRWLAGEQGEAMEAPLKEAAKAAYYSAYAASNAASNASYNTAYAASHAAAHAAYAAYNAASYEAYAASYAAAHAASAASSAAYALAEKNNKKEEFYEKQFLEQLFELSLGYYSKHKAVKLLYGS